MSKSRRPLTLEERSHISLYLSKHFSVRMIARTLGRNPSIISREIERNSIDGRYSMDSAQHRSHQRRRAASSRPRKLTDDLLRLITGKITQQFSPQQISGWLKNFHTASFSHESIYRLIRCNRASGGDLYTNLRHWKKRYRKRLKSAAGCHLIPGRVDISQRPSIVDTKSRVGDWEADTIIGANQKGALVTLVERNSKFLLTALVPNKTKKAVTAAINKLLSPYADLVHTITFDNGGEFADHQKIAKKLNARTFFARPYHSWERGLNEHTNGLIRQYFPKGTNFLNVSPQEVQKVQNSINVRPRNVLLFFSPQQVFSNAHAVAYRT